MTNNIINSDTDKPRVLILGGTGMLGHKLWQCFSERFVCAATLRHRLDPQTESTLFGLSQTHAAQYIAPVAVEEFDSVVKAIADFEPDVVINCIGIVKQDSAARDPLRSIPVNSLFPHRLKNICRVRGCRLIHISTDCVFSGNKGSYRESDFPDADDLYGRTKLLGEVDGDHCLTLRTSIIGRELMGSHGLLEWFFQQEGTTVRGFKRAIFSGFTTNALAEIIASVILERPQLSGLWHVAAHPISKFDLLTLVQQMYSLNISIEPDESVVCDRSLDGSRFADATGLKVPDWRSMIEQMKYDATPYPELRRQSYADR